jgi:hypothetical protein
MRLALAGALAAMGRGGGARGGAPNGRQTHISKPDAPSRGDA